MTVAMLSSCENNRDTVSEQALLSIRKFSQTYPSPKDAQPVVYMILCVGIEDNTPITNAIFGDSSHINMTCVVSIDKIEEVYLGYHH